MNAKLHLGVAKWLEGDTLGNDAGQDPTGVFARIVPMEGRGKAIQMLVPIGRDGPTSLIDVPAGRLAVQVRLPSGEILSDDIEVGEGGEMKLVLQSQQRSPHEWLSWPRMVSPMATSLSKGKPDPAVENLALHLWMREPAGAISHDHAHPWVRETDPELGVLSCIFRVPPAAGQRMYLAVDVPGPNRMLVTVPLPWHAEPQRRPTTVQVVVKLSREEEGKPAQATDVDVLVQDTWLAPMLGYLHSGDLAAAREFEAGVRKRAERMLLEKDVNPLAAAAGGYLLLQTRALEQMHDWPRNLANRFEWLPDGPILWATQLLRTSSRKRDLGEARKWLHEAVRRGAPVFTEGVRLLSEGMRLVANWESNESSNRKPGSSMDEAAAAWVERLESATRPDSLFTVLEDDDGHLQSLVAGWKP